MLYALAALSALSALGGANAQRGGGSDSSSTVDVNVKPAGHYLFPPSRGTNQLVAGTGPCQGWELGNRVLYPVTGGQVTLTATKDISTVEFRYSTNADPQSVDDFQSGSSVAGEVLSGQTCVDGPDFSALGLSAGANVTMMFTYTAGPQKSRTYECADLTLVSASDFTAANVDTQCVNRWASTQRKRVSASNPTLYALQQEAEAEAAASSGSSSESSSTSSSNNSGLSVTEAGVVGSMVTLGTVLLVLAITYISGLIGPGPSTKKGRQASYAAETKSVASA